VTITNGRFDRIGRGGMSRRHAGRRRARFIALAVAVVAVVPPAAAAESEPGAKLPRFVSLRSDHVNLRVGPGGTYPIQWVLTRKEMPVEIVREFEHWRMIRDWQGTEGWVHERMVSRKRGVVVRGGVRALHRQPDSASEVIARAEPGVFARLVECRVAWCRIEAAEITGWVQRGEVWGIYPDEAVQ
jgi:SH3-like domain-containing protein